MSQEKEILKVPAQISGVKTMSDRGLRISVDTQEISPADAGQVMMMKGKIGWFVFAEQVGEEDIKNLPQIQLEEGEKSPTARLRAVLFVYWDKHKIAEPFDIFFRRKIESFIGAVKEKID